MRRNEIFANIKEIAAGLPLPKFRKLNKADVILIVTSFLCALVLWIYIAAEVTTDFSLHFDHLPVTIDLTGTRAESYHLDLLPESRQFAESLTVDCDIDGTRAAIGALTSLDVEAYIDFDSTVANTIGTQVFPIQLRTKSGRALSGVTLSRSSVELEMDRYETKAIKVSEVKYPNLSYDDETRISTDEISYEPSTVDIYGPSTRLAAIDHICVNIDSAEELVQTKTFSDCTDFSLIDKDGNIAAGEAFQVQQPRFSVRIPVYYARSLPVTVVIENPPTNFDVDTVMRRIRINANDAYTLPDYGDKNLMIKIETSDPAKKEQLDQLKAWTIGSISLAELAPGSSKEIPITMSTGFTDGSNLGSVYISLDASDLTVKRVWMKNSDIQRIDPDQRYTYMLEDPDGNTPISLIGTEEELAQIESEDLKATLRLFSISVSKEGTYNEKFNVTLPSTVSGVWVCPTPTINIIVKVAS